MARTTIPETALGPLMGAGAVLVSGAVVFALLPSGPLSIQMAQHLLAMNVVAPLLAVLLRPSVPRKIPGVLLWAAAAAQLALLWAWHAPAVQAAAAASFPLNLALGGLLALAALAFWTFLIDAAGKGRWSAVGALLVTGKLACLLGVLMIFAPRDLYLLPGLSIPLCTTGPSTLEDQQLAGLLMITACPLSYLVAGVVFTAQMFAQIDRPGGSESSRLALR